MKCIALAGFSALRASGLVDDLIAALTIDGCTVSAVKRAPDDFDLDQPGKWSHLRREAGCGEVMLVGARRFALLHEFGAAPAPPLADLLARLAPVDIVLLEGFRDAAVPTIAVVADSARAAPGGTHDANVVALVAGQPVDSPLPTFAPDDAAGLAAFIVAL
jgi:molybdopterin-guanine dinucleotide biosynthesis protein MobB